MSPVLRSWLNIVTASRLFFAAGFLLLLWMCKCEVKNCLEANCLMG